MVDYLVHYNKNHSKANGQFVSGDGDGDGIANDHAHRNNNGSSKKERKPLSKKARVAIGVTGAVVGTGAIVAGAIGLGKEIAWQKRQRKFRDAWNSKQLDLANKTIDLYKSIPFNSITGVDYV